MDATKKITALFDCDGVIVDTEGQYTVSGMKWAKSM